MSEIETVTPETPAEQPANTNTGKNGKPKKSAKREALEWVLTIVAALAIAFVIRTFLHSYHFKHFRTSCFSCGVLLRRIFAVKQEVPKQMQPRQP